MPHIRMNLFRDFANSIRNNMGSNGYDISSVNDDDEAALRLYASLSRRIIAPKPRQILKASNFDPSNYEDGIARLEKAIRNGESLVPYMSTKINDMGFHDSLLDTWGIYHFHLGTELPENGHFIKRTRDVLLCRIDNCFAYFIKILPHGRNTPAPWYKKELIEIIHKNWPQSIKHALAVGATEISPSFNDQEIAELRRYNIAVFLKMSDGTIYMAPGVGNTLGLVTGDGSNVNDMRFADKIKYMVEWVEIGYWRTINKFLKMPDN